MSASIGRAWRWVAAHAGPLGDAMLGALVMAAAVAEAASGVLSPAWAWSALGVVSGIAVATLRRRQPLVLLAGLLVLHAAVPAGPETEPPFYYFLALITAFSLGAYVRPRTGLLGLAALVVSYSTYTLRSEAPDSGPVEALAGSIFISVFFAIGVAFAATRRRAERLQSHAASLIVEREGHARVAVEEERRRIARELHDAVAHDVSMMTLQIGAVRHRLLDEQERERDVLMDLERAGREAVDDLRRIVGILRRRDGGGDRSPRPSMTQLESLVERVCDAGIPVELEVTGDPAQLPPGVDASAYRIVQEALTNVVRHASGAATRVRVDQEQHELRLEIVNRPPPVPGGSEPNAPGHGLIGMRERATLFGGELHAEAQADGGFAVRARFPLGGTPAGVAEGSRG